MWAHLKKRRNPVLLTVFRRLGKLLFEPKECSVQCSDRVVLATQFGPTRRKANWPLTTDH